MKSWLLISAASIALTIIMIFLWLIVPGFPLLIFLLFPPIYWWGIKRTETMVEDQREPALHHCPRCGKRLLEPFQPFCPACGYRLHEES
jgi:ribosomal protein L37E